MDFEDRDSSPKSGSVRCGLVDVLHRSGDATEDFGLDQEACMDEEADLPSDLVWLQDLSEESDSDGDLARGADNGKRRSYAETARMFKLRRNLDQLDAFHRQKEHDVQTAREKLKLCCQNIESWLEQRENLEWGIEQQKAKDNSVAVFRLRAQHALLCQKLQDEEELRGQIHAELRQQELELNEVEVELGRVSLLRQEVQEEEQLFQVLKAQKAVTRLQQERKASQNQQRKMKLLRAKQAAKLEEGEETECQRKTEEARASQKKAAKYLKQTIKRLHQQAAQKEQQNREFIERRMQAVESLKSNIAANQESLRVRQNRAKKEAQKKEQQERQLQVALEAQGINSIRHMHQKKQLEETKRKQQEFEESQKSKRAGIVAKILQEEQLLKSRRRNQSQPPKPPTNDKFSSLRTGRDMLLSYLDPNPPSLCEETATPLVREFSDVSRSSSTCSDSEHPEKTEESVQKCAALENSADSLAEPEFTGLWEQEDKKASTKDMTSAKEDVEKGEPVKASRKLNVASKKILGKELKRPPFTSKPEVVLFKDFEVGKCYKKKIVLTNISYGVSQCRFVRVSDQLMDFISVSFDPPGSLPTGMSCEMQACFQPLLNEDLDGEFQFATPLGPFSVPVRCATKKCSPEVDCQFVDFGSHVVGQTVSRTITLKNKGALAGFFSLDTSAHVRPESSRVQMTSRASANTGPETYSEKTTSSDRQSSDSLDSQEVQPKQANLSEEVQQMEPESCAEAVSEARLSSDVDAQINQTFLDSCDITLGDVREGELGPFQCIKLEIFFTPTIPGETRRDFYIRFSDANTKPIPIQVRGLAVSIPVWVVQPNVDLKICMFDCLYQHSVLIQSRANTALKVTFEVCPEMRKHMEILPKNGFIQAQSTFNAQLKFLPRQSLSKDAENFFDSDTGVLEVPMTVQVAGQPKFFTRPKHSSNLIVPPSPMFQRCVVQVTFRPGLLEHEIEEEALRQLRHTQLICRKESEQNALAEQEMERAISAEGNKGKRPSGNAKNSKVSEEPNTDSLTKSPDPVDVIPGPELYEEARASLLRSFTRRYREYTVSCFVSDGDPTETDRQVQPAWSPINTLYLKLECPAEQPPLLVTSNNGTDILDFHQVLVGHKVIKRFTVQNISKDTLDLRSSLLDIHGPFSLLNAMRGLSPGETHTLILAFSPTSEKKCCETLEVQTWKMVLEITLRGEGVLPVVTSSPTGDLLDFGYVLEKDSVSQQVQLANSSVVPVVYRVLLASQSLSSPQHGADRIALLLDGYRGSQTHPAVGTQNHSGLSVFSATPVEGSIAPGQTQDISISFQPDHPSLCYSDKLTIELMNKSKVCVMNLKGAASSHNMYLCGGDPLTVPIESLLPSLITPHPQLTEAEEKPSIPVLVTLRASCRAGVIGPAVRELQVGCIRSPHTSKKSGEFYWDNVATLQQQGFQLEPVKGSVEAGHRRPVSITWTPQSGHKPFQVVQACAHLTVKSDEISIYKVTLVGFVSSAAE
ncbi:cilia- and flagella-associated protein 74 [Fundulus heteroclitus]|uniref:cilia- and flagella-associated protein 74 n=1 Tax=Fundulus heteroclitus TaxID=8078 RepID=UPI00165CD963|nr:cilia- and flagella-associated protein 74 [Fundulus heteroclitus]